MKIFAVVSIKGGVGKTAAAINLADCAARRGNRVLLWDLDPQGASSFYLRVKPRVKGGLDKLLHGRKGLRPRIRASDFPGLDLMPADFSYRRMDLALDAAGKAQTRIDRLLRPLADDYDVAVLDCPPGVSLGNESVFGAADVLVSPVIPTPLSMRTHAQLSRLLRDLPSPRPSLVSFFSMVDRRRALHRELTTTIRLDDPSFLETIVPYASIVEQMGVARAPLAAFAPRSGPALAYAQLWMELEKRFLYEV